MTSVLLWDRLVDDAAMFPPGLAGPAEAVARHVQYRTGAADQPPYVPAVVGPLVVPDTALAAVDRAVAAIGAGPIEVSVVSSTGAGGLVALAGRELGDLSVVAVEVALRDLDDLAGNAERVAQAARALPEPVRVFVELPYARGWEHAAEVVEAAGLLGKIRTGGTEPEHHPSAVQLAEQLSVLVETDLSFKATAGLHHAVRHVGHNDRGTRLEQHGLLNLMVAVHALADGSDRAEVETILDEDHRDRLAERVGSWTNDDAARVRRRFVGFGCCGVLDPIGDLVTLGLL